MPRENPLSTRQQDLIYHTLPTHSIEQKSVDPTSNLDEDILILYRV